MSTLFLDDNLERIARMTSASPHAVIVTTAKEAIDKIASCPIWGTVWLDHDLNGERFVDSGRTDCGMEVVRWLEKTHQPVYSFMIHTCNERAAIEMQQRLEGAGYSWVQRIPFDGEYDGS